ncbi:hypothetical protein Tco_1155234 [Tanacetum coccineum]
MGRNTNREFTGCDILSPLKDLCPQSLGRSLRRGYRINEEMRENSIKGRCLSHPFPPEECYELIENMTTHHNHWDTSETRDETSRNISSTTTTESPEVVRQLEMMNKNFGDVKAITTRSGVAYDGPTIPPTPSPLPKEVERETEVTKDKGGDFILEEIKACLTNDSIPPGIDDADFDPEGDLFLLEKLLNDDPYSHVRFRRITYTEISSTFEELSDIGSPGVVPSPDYIPGPEEPQSPPPLDCVPELSPDYVLESDPEADPKEDDDEDPEEDPVAADGGDDRDDEDEPSEEDEDDDVDIEADEDEEEEEHPAPADSVVVALPATDQAPSAEETEPFETDESAATPPPHPAYRVTARISIPAPVPTPVWSDAEVARLLAISTPPSSPLSPWSSPLPQIPSPSLPLSPPSPVLSPTPPPSPICLLGYQAAMIRLRAEAASTSHSLPLPPPFILSPTRSDAPSSGIPPPLPISVPTSSPPLLLPSASRREDRLEVTLPPRKMLATMDREIRRDPQREVGYGITDSWDEIVETLQGVLVSTDTELG